MKLTLKDPLMLGQTIFYYEMIKEKMVIKLLFVLECL